VCWVQTTIYYIKFKSNHTGGTYLVFVYVKDDREISLQSYKNLLTLSRFFFFIKVLVLYNTHLT